MMGESKRTIGVFVRSGLDAIPFTLKAIVFTWRRICLIPMLEPDCAQIPKRPDRFGILLVICRLHRPRITYEACAEIRLCTFAHSSISNMLQTQLTTNSVYE